MSETIDWYLLANVFTFVCALGAFIYGGVHFLRPKKAMYAQMITLAIGCVAFGRMFNVIRLLTEGSLTQTFQLGFLGMVGSLMFFISSNYGTIDSLIDDHSKKFRKYRMTALFAPVLALSAYVILFPFAEIPMLWKILGGILTLFIMAASYFHLKHLIFPEDKTFAVVRWLRGFNLIAFIYMAALMVECYAMSRENQLMMTCATAAIGVLVVLMMPMVVRGVKKW